MGTDVVIADRFEVEENAIIQEFNLVISEIIPKLARNQRSYGILAQC